MKWELINYCELDKYASKAYSVIHNVNENKNLGDIIKVNAKNLQDFDLMTWGFPCTDISICGKQQGLIDNQGNQTRSGLYYEGLRILKEKKPKVSIIENVKALTSKKFKKEFEMILSDLEKIGYNNHYKVINSKDYGSVQSRERIYIVSIRKDIDNGLFSFIDKIDNKKVMKDIVENLNENDYYLSDNKIEKIYNWKAGQRPFTKVLGQNSVCPTITARGCGEYHSGMILYSDKLLDTTNCELKENPIEFIKSIRPRVPTELEAFRIMGFSDEDYYSCQNANIPSRQLYKITGNSIVVDVLYHIYLQLYKAIPDIFEDLKVISFFSGMGAFEKALDKLYSRIS